MEWVLGVFVQIKLFKNNYKNYKIFNEKMTVQTNASNGIFMLNSSLSYAIMLVLMRKEVAVR